MLIKVDKDTQITADDNNYKLEYRIKSKNGLQNWRTEGYYSTLASCINEVLDASPRRATQATGDLKKVIEIIQTAEKKLTLAISKNK